MLNYAVIIQYLTQQLNIPNVRIAEWHVELEDNRPEEIPPWKEQI